MSTYCASSGSGSTPVGGGDSGESYSCKGWLARDGFYINGEKEGTTTVCLSNEIKISPINPYNDGKCTVSGVVFPLVRKWKKGKCNELENHPSVQVCRQLLFGKCECLFIQLFISIIEVDNNYNAISPEYADWMNFSYPDVTTGYDLREFNLKNYLPNGAVLQPGKHYRLKIATSGYNGWEEYTRYIFTYSNNINFDGLNPASNVYGGDITIQNSTINQQIEVVANNSITLLPGTTLKAGHCYIDETSDCNSFKNKSMPKVNNNNSNYNKNELFLSNQKMSENTNHNISIYPNPTNGQFNIKIDANLTEFVELELIDLLGNTILKIVDTKNTYTFNLSGYPKGVYLLRTKIDAKLNVQKVIYQ